MSDYVEVEAVGGLRNLLSSWSTFKSSHEPLNSIACYNQIAPVIKVLPNPERI